MESKHKRNYSLGWLIFWIIVCFPVAYYYYFKKQYLDKKILKKSPQKYIFIGLIIFYIFIMISGLVEDQQTTPEQKTLLNEPTTEETEQKEIKESKRQIEIDDSISKPSVGSSSISIGGSLRRASIIATFCCIPLERLFTGSVLLSES